MEEKEYISSELLVWTPQAIECYRRNCICSGCFIYEHIETECSMKRVVPKIYALQGSPKESLDIKTQRLKIEKHSKESKTNKMFYEFE